MLRCCIHGDVLPPALGDSPPLLPQSMLRFLRMRCRARSPRASNQPRTRRRSPATPSADGKTPQSPARARYGGPTGLEWLAELGANYVANYTG